MTGGGESREFVAPVSRTALPAGCGPRHPVPRSAWPDPGAIPPGHGFGQVIDEYRIQPQRLAHVAHGAAGAVGDNGGGQGGALAGILVVDVLDDLFAALVLEIHIDIRWLVALSGNKALKQQ